MQSIFKKEEIISFAYVLILSFKKSSQCLILAVDN